MLAARIEQPSLGFHETGGHYFIVLASDIIFLLLNVPRGYASPCGTKVCYRVTLML